MDKSLEHDIDVMRDVYMTKAQREAYDRIAAIALMRGQSWQPIETAPKDGRDFLICDMTAEAPGADLVLFRDGEFIACSSEFHDNNDMDASDIGVYRNPTHWQPLPAPPKDPADDQ